MKQIIRRIIGLIIISVFLLAIVSFTGCIEKGETEPFPEEEMELLTLKTYGYYSKGNFSNVFDYEVQRGYYWTLFRGQDRLGYRSLGSRPCKRLGQAYDLIETTKKQGLYPLEGGESFIWCILKDGELVKWGVEGDFEIGKAPYHVRTPDNVEEEMDLQYPLDVKDLVVTKEVRKNGWYHCDIYNPYYFPVNITYHYTHLFRKGEPFH